VGFISSVGDAFGEMFTMFGLEVLIGGMLSGVMYSLVAIGFVLIYKSSGVFNYAQGTITHNLFTNYADFNFNSAIISPLEASLTA